MSKSAPDPDTMVEAAMADMRATAPSSLRAERPGRGRGGRPHRPDRLADRHPLRGVERPRGAATSESDPFDCGHAGDDDRAPALPGRLPSPTDSGRPSLAVSTAIVESASTLDLRGHTEFERDVWRKALDIPRGEVRPYGWIAAEIGRPRAVRAVGTALGHNPVPLIVPCHRVVRTDGSIGQYSPRRPGEQADDPRRRRARP